MESLKSYEWLMGRPGAWLLYALFSLCVGSSTIAVQRNATLERAYVREVEQPLVRAARALTFEDMILDLDRALDGARAHGWTQGRARPYFPARLFAPGLLPSDEVKPWYEHLVAIRGAAAALDPDAPPAVRLMSFEVLRRSIDRTFPPSGMHRCGHQLFFSLCALLSWISFLLAWLVFKVRGSSL